MLSLDEYLRENEPYHETLFIKRLKAGGFTDDQIVKILSIMDKTCLYCFDGDHDCQCWNDE